ncbi:unnamed protein product [Oppiella nova]|uniref:N-acetylgalactosaminide beta-1,3-galactosyltransferase n=1 Tax=Oppiella nova TaxID=334625 RepID=A0A7R9QGZ8_9ACAR|nr:unnamed protein product [Oppiella nova]CAG2165153.1 unnamed protein product [Oppiella nova]
MFRLNGNNMHKLLKILNIISFVVLMSIILVLINDKNQQLFILQTDGINDNLDDYNEYMKPNKSDLDIPQHTAINSMLQRPRLLCMVTTTPDYHDTKAIAVNETWGKRCDTLLYVSSQTYEGLDVIKSNCSIENHDYLWCKNREGLVEAHRRYNGSYDWLFKADDDTYVVIENLIHLVSGHNPSEAIWFGQAFHEPIRNITFFTGGPGYIFSAEAVNRLVTSFETKRKYCDISEEKGPDDVYFAACLEGSGTVMGDDRDSLGEPRFFHFAPDAWLNPHDTVYHKKAWLKNYATYNYSAGMQCCSSSTVSFHYVTPDYMYVLEFLLYKLKVQGIN